MKDSLKKRDILLPVMLMHFANPPKSYSSDSLSFFRPETIAGRELKRR